MIRPLFAAAGFMLLAGCVSGDMAEDGAFYPSGFSDGCRTAEALQSSFGAKSYRDDRLFKTEPSYRAGWRAGSAQCKTEDLDNRPGDLGEWEPQ